MVYRTKALVFAMGMFLGVAGAAECRASVLCDWLFHRNTAPRTSFYAPTTAFYSPTVTANYPGACNSCNVYSTPRLVTRYAPQTSYRTVWSRAATTVYRPVAGVDPTTGCQTTCMRPCTTWRWQVQRVPYTTFRPFYSWTSCFAPAYGTTAYATRTTGSACGTCNGIGCPTCAPARAVTTVVPSPMTAMPGPTPADAPPSLDPGTIQGGGAPAAEQNGGSYRMEKTPAAEPTTKPSVVPIPDVQGGERARLNSDAAPALLGPAAPSKNTENHTAYRQAAPVPRTLAVRPAVLLRPAAADDEWDDSGWESAR